MINSFLINSPILASIAIILTTIAIYQISASLQQKWQSIWLNPMLITISLLVPTLVISDINYDTYSDLTYALNLMLEPAIVALG